MSENRLAKFLKVAGGLALAAPALTACDAICGACCAAAGACSAYEGDVSSSGCCAAKAAGCCAAAEAGCCAAAGDEGAMVDGEDHAGCCAAAE